MPGVSSSASRLSPARRGTAPSSPVAACSSVTRPRWRASISRLTLRPRDAHLDYQGTFGEAEVAGTIKGDHGCENRQHTSQRSRNKPGGIPKGPFGSSRIGGPISHYLPCPLLYPLGWASTGKLGEGWGIGPSGWLGGVVWESAPNQSLPLVLLTPLLTLSGRSAAW